MSRVNENIIENVDALTSKFGLKSQQTLYELFG